MQNYHEKQHLLDIFELFHDGLMMIMFDIYHYQQILVQLILYMGTMSKPLIFFLNFKVQLDIEFGYQKNDFFDENEV